MVIDGRRWRATDPLVPEVRRDQPGWEQTDDQRRARWETQVPEPGARRGGPE